MGISVGGIPPHREQRPHSIRSPIVGKQRQTRVFIESVEEHSEIAEADPEVRLGLEQPVTRHRGVQPLGRAGLHLRVPDRARRAHRETAE